ncbi:MAG: hypothetical protein WAX77_08280 [Methylococcaceae bacterium]
MLRLKKRIVGANSFAQLINKQREFVAPTPIIPFLLSLRNLR